MCHTRVIFANEIFSTKMMFHTYIQEILWKKFQDWCLPDKQHPILRFPLVEGRDVLLQLQLYRQTLPSTGGNLRIGCCLSGRHQSGKFFHRISCIYVWNIIMMLWISFARITLVWHILLNIIWIIESREELLRGYFWTSQMFLDRKLKKYFCVESSLHISSQVP